jgi:RHS repeat-associated protein
VGSSVTQYAGNFIYENGSLAFFSHPEGYVFREGTGEYRYVYQYRDHLDNIRLSYTEDPSNPGQPTIIEENNYYPFGGRHQGYNNGGDTALGNDLAQMWKFGGKELDESLGLDTYDFGARNYDPWLGRWMNIDPLAEQMRRHSPYNYAFDNPIWFIDPDGMKPFDWRDKNGNLVYDAQKGEYTKYATAEHKRFGSSLLKTAAGREQFNKLVTSSIPITTEISSGKGPSSGSKFTLGQTFRTSDGKTGKVKKAEIKIYEGRIDDFMETVEKFFDAGQESKLSEQQQLFFENTTTSDERIAAVAGHEIEHATSEENHKLTGPAGEVEPEAIETEILKQTPGSRPLKLNPMPIKVEPIKIEVPEIKY